MHNPRRDRSLLLLILLFSSEDDLLCAPALVSSPRRIELNRMFQVMYGAPPTLLSFTLAGILSKRLEDYAFAAAPSPLLLPPEPVGVGGGPVSRVCGQDYNGL